MKTNPINTEQLLLQSLEKKGIKPSLIPGLIKDLANSFFLNPSMNLSQVNNRLHSLGWNNIDLDYHTLQLAKECFEINNEIDLRTNAIIKESIEK